MMEEIVTLRLETEMDLLLANRRTIKLAELCGLTPIHQTGLATAVSEVARAALSFSKNASVTLGITILSSSRKKITAVVHNCAPACENSDAFGFAKRLISEIEVIARIGSYCDIQLNQDIRLTALITDAKIQSFVEHFQREAPQSPYDEVRRKSLQLLEFSQKLEESERQYQRLTDTLPLMMFVANPDGSVTYTNKWLRNFLGDTLTTIVPTASQPFTHPDDRESLYEAWNTSYCSGTIFNAQARLFSKATGRYIWHLISILPVKNEINSIIQWTGFLVDIDAQKLVEATLKDNVELNEAKQRLVSYQRKLEEKIYELNTSNNSLEQFAYIASHDLQEPLRKIATFSALLQGHLRDLDDVSKLYFSRIIASSVQMTDQIKDVLEWSGLARSEETFSPVDLNAIIESVKSNLEVQIKERSAVIQSSRLPIVKGSRLQLIRLFSNLVSNALKFSPGVPVVTISSRLMSTTDAGLHTKLDSTVSYAEVAVSDNGVGFKQEYAEQIFRIFQRLHGHHEYKGTGIGLAICKKIAENHRGEVYATSKPGQGATFTSILPMALQE